MYICKSDNSTLNNELDKLVCPKCKKIFNKTHGMPTFINEFCGEELNQKEIYERRSNSLTDSDFLNFPIILNHFVRKRYMDYLKIEQNMKILDIGTQDGVHLRYLKRKFPFLKDDDMYGIDITLSGLMVGSKHDAFHFSLSSVYDLPFTDNSFDVIVANGVIEHLENPSNGLREIARVLKPGGQFVSYITVSDYRFSFQWIMNDLFKNKKMIYQSTEAIGHDFVNIIKPLKEYQKMFFGNKLIIDKEERTNILIQPFIDYLGVSIIEKFKSNLPVSDKYIARDNNIISDKKKSNKKKVLHYIMKCVDILLVMERILLSRYVGISYNNYGKKSIG